MTKLFFSFLLFLAPFSYGQCNDDFFKKNISPVADRIWKPFQNKIELLSSNYRSKIIFSSISSFGLNYYDTDPNERCQFEPGTTTTVFFIQYNSQLNTPERQIESIHYFGCEKIPLFQIEIERKGTDLKPLEPLSIQKGELNFFPKESTSSIKINFFDYKTDSIFSWLSTKDKHRLTMELFAFDKKLIAANFEKSTNELYINSSSKTDFSYKFYGANFNRTSNSKEENHETSVIKSNNNILSDTYILNLNEIVSQSDFNNHFNEDILSKIDNSITSVINILLKYFTPTTETAVVANAETTEFLQDINILLTQARTNTINVQFLDEFLIKLRTDIQDGKIEINSN